MLRRTPLRFTAVALTALVAGAAASPALAATQVAKGTATAANISIAGMGTDTGTYTASNDGKSETTSGTNTPAIPLLNGQQVVSAGTFAQDAKTTVKDGAVGTKACAGFAGQGATLAAVGDGNCLIGGQTLNLSAGAVRLQQPRSRRRRHPVGDAPGCHVGSVEGGPAPRPS